MRIVIAPDSFKESLPAAAVAAAIARGVRAALPAAECVTVPLADGGEGTLAALVAATGGRVVERSVCGPLGTPVMARYGLLGDGHRAVVEMAQASGLELVPPAERDPTRTTSFGTGELLAAALADGAREFIVGIGGSATNDGGAGLLQALGVRFFDVRGAVIVAPLSGGTLDLVARIDTSALDGHLAGVRVQVACDVDNPLTGPRGAAAVYGPQKGASPDQVARLDEALARFYGLVAATLGVDVAARPGSGAAGGTGAALAAFLGADLRPGIDIVLEAVGLRDHLAGADLVITGEGCVDAQTRHGKAPWGVARLAHDLGVPVVAVGGSLADAAEGLLDDGGFDALEAAVTRPQTTADALAAATTNLERAGRRIGHWLALGRRVALAIPASPKLG